MWRCVRLKRPGRPVIAERADSAAVRTAVPRSEHALPQRQPRAGRQRPLGQRFERSMPARPQRDQRARRRSRRSRSGRGASRCTSACSGDEPARIRCLEQRRASVVVANLDDQRPSVERGATLRTRLGDRRRQARYPRAERAPPCRRRDDASDETVDDGSRSIRDQCRDNHDGARPAERADRPRRELLRRTGGRRHLRDHRHRSSSVLRSSEAGALIGAGDHDAPPGIAATHRVR